MELLKISSLQKVFPEVKLKKLLKLIEEFKIVESRSLVKIEFKCDCGRSMKLEFNFNKCECGKIYFHKTIDFPQKYVTEEVTEKVNKILGSDLRQI